MTIRKYTNAVLGTDRHRRTELERALDERYLAQNLAMSLGDLPSSDSHRSAVIREVRERVASGNDTEDDRDILASLDANTQA
jgi:hypothetical protein